ncbi:hybrid sensor histidine kinase/response regulator transcription factor [Algoriphagus zhangzhouensis]|uniref:histidine kinase n=1 Tax=Algoriphagus zhangzhouensis TaxID=1073327 RepID=A0A1M7ZI83_9BACT|nr:hybrid sensor histidine kinase/response regulator transcription factor [Algoriphagus zhangzhouensis]TDY44352.1 signal transduction histidine kinase [Algoriphagus zhangzhouensis]SHO64601.1 Signal transduction histidine kinase [Algoriphagus zhangzhouensis]
MNQFLSRLKVTLLLLWSLFAFIQKGKSQSDISFRQLSVNQGLSQNSAVSVTQDQEGYLWIATQDGLNKYDGRQFTIFPKKFSDITQKNQLVLGKVLADKNHRIWIIPDSQNPEVLRPGKIEFEPISEILGATYIFEDTEDAIWIATQYGQLFRWNEKLDFPELLFSNSESDLVHISQFDKDFLILTFTDSVYLFDKNTFELKTLISSDIQGLFSVSQLIPNGQVLMGTLNQGLWLWDPTEEKIEKFQEAIGLKVDPIQQQMVLDILVDSKGKVWIATYGAGAYLLDLENPSMVQFSNFKQNPRSLHYNDILCLFEDYTKTVWLGTDGGGLSFYDSYLEKFNFYHNNQVPEDINIDVVRSIYADSSFIWIGTSGKGLTQFDRKDQSWKTFKAANSGKQSLQGNRIMSLFKNENELWIGYQGDGMSIYDLKTKTFRHFGLQTSPSLPARTVWKIFKDAQNRVWLCTRNEGLFQFDKNQGVVQSFQYNAGEEGSIPENNIRDIIQVNENEFWIGTENMGIAKLDLSSGLFSSIPAEENEISSTKIKSLYLGPENYLWIGTNGSGLNRLNLETWENRVFDTKSGLANDVVYGILPDELGNLWLSSNRGITQIKLQGNDNYAIFNYNNYDGLATEFNTGAYFKDQQGLLYFGSLEGLYWFQAKNIELNSTPPKTVVSGLQAFDKTVDIGRKIKIPYDQNTLTFTISSMFFSSPGKNQFQYKLDGYDKDWNFNGNNSIARYTNLPPGDYTFLANSSNYDGIWSETPDQIKFTIAPPWYGSMLAKFLYFVLFVLLIYWTYQYLVWRFKIQFELKSKNEEAQRLREMDQFKTSFFTNISHEFRTPLTLIMGPVQKLLGQTENPQVKSQLNLIQQNSIRLLNLVDQLLEASKLKSGRINLKVRKGNLSLLLQTLVINFYYLANEKGMNLISKGPLITEVWFDADKIEKIVGNLLQNAIKYGKAKSDIHLNWKADGSQLLLQIKNFSSQYYSEYEKELLFEKFFKPDPKSEGFGLGLPLVKDLVELHRGQITLQIPEGNLFEISISIPLDRYSYDSEEIWEESNSILEKKRITGKKSTGSTENLMILLVDDNQSVREFLNQELEENYTILQAENGKEGIDIALDKIPDLIISDIMMPEVDGLQLCETLKNDERTSHIPIILLTAKIEEENKIKGLKVGADDYIYKPFTTNSLLIRIQNLIDLRRNLRNRYSGKTKISPKELAVSSSEEKFLQKVQKIVDNELMDVNFTIEDFCKNIGMSRMQLHRKLTAITGLSTSAFIRDQRLKKAEQKLKSGDENISEIAYSVGFSSPSYFIRCFKETYHMTPKEYQETKK